MDNFCWETLVHQVLDENQTIYPVSIEEVDISFHRLYPYYMFLGLILLSFPMLVWTGYAQKNVFTPTQYLVSGIQESMNMAVATVADLIDDDSVFCESEELKG